MTGARTVDCENAHRTDAAEGVYARYRDGRVFIHIIFEKAQLPAYE